MTTLVTIAQKAVGAVVAGSAIGEAELSPRIEARMYKVRMAVVRTRYITG